LPEAAGLSRLEGPGRPAVGRPRADRGVAEGTRSMKDPLGRLFPNLPREVRVVLDWIFTIAGAILIVLALKAWVVNPYRIPSSSMEPTLHCARPSTGCEAHFSDRVLANRFIYRFRDPKRGEIIVFKTPGTKPVCGTDHAGEVFVKRLIGLPGEHVSERDGYMYVNNARLNEPYIQASRRDHEPPRTWTVPKGE